IARAADGAWRGLEQDQAVGIGSRVGERRTLPTELIVLANLLPHRSHDVDHLPVGHPLAAGALALLALAAGDGAFHGVSDTSLGADGNVRLHAALPQRELSLGIGRVDG